MDQNFLIKTVSANEGKRNYKGANLRKPGAICTQDSSPCNVSKNMKKVNNETYGSKKFFQGIEADSNNRNYEIVKKDSVTDDIKSAPLVLHRETSKENAKLVGTQEHKLGLDAKVEKRKYPRAPKQALKRGMTVKFQGDEDILCMVEKNQDLVRKFCKSKSFRKNMKTRITSENNRVKKNKDKEIAKKQNKSTKHNLELYSKSSSNQYSDDKYFTHHCTPTQKDVSEEIMDSILDEGNRSIPFHLHTESDFDFRKKNLVYEHNVSEGQHSARESVTFSRASFVAIQAKPTNSIKALN